MSCRPLFAIMIAAAMVSNAAAAGPAFIDDDDATQAHAHATERTASPTRVAVSNADPKSKFVDDDDAPFVDDDDTPFIDDDNEPPAPTHATNRSASQIGSGKNSASPHGANLVIDTGKVTLKIEMIEKAETQRVSEAKTQFPVAIGYYVIVASARLEGAIGTRTIDTVAACTGLRPHLGLTQTGQGSFQVPAHAAYFGPYATRAQAFDQRAVISGCVPDAYIGSGSIARY